MGTWIFNHSKCRKLASKWKWNEIEYHVQDRKNVSHISLKMLCTTTQFPSLSFCVPHEKPHGVIGLSKIYHLQLDPKSVYGKCAIRIIPCSCIACTTMLDKLWAYVVDPNKQPSYQPVVDCTYCPVLDSFNN